MTRLRFLLLLALATSTALAFAACTPVDLPLGDATAGSGGVGAAGSSGNPSAAGSSGILNAAGTNAFGTGSSPLGNGQVSGRACDPLATLRNPTTISAADIVGAGRAIDGTIYVVTGVLFVGSGDTLVEQFDTGGSFSLMGSPTQYWTHEYLDATGTTVTVQIQKNASGTLMGVVKGPMPFDPLNPGKLIDFSSTGEVLAPIAPATAAAMKGIGLEMFWVDFAGTLADGRYIVVVAPYESAELDQFRVFFGPASALQEVVPMNFRLGDLNTGFNFPKLATLTLPDGSQAELEYVSVGTGDLTYHDLTSGNLTFGTGDPQPLTGSTGMPVAPPGAAFFCL